MEQYNGLKTQAELLIAKQKLHPKNFGFEPYGRGWTKELKGFGETVFTKVGWEAAQVKHNFDGNGDISLLDYIYRIQQQQWGETDAIPSDVLGILEETGGHLLAAYSKEKGFSPEGWAGLAVGFGSDKGILESHMVVVRPDIRGISNVGMNLKLIQAHEAISQNFNTVRWTYNPFQSLNARLNIEKLGGEVTGLILNRYGQSVEYDNIPSHRFVLDWKITSPQTQDRLKAVHEGTYQSPSLAEIEQELHVSPQTIDEAVSGNYPYLVYEIPGDHTRLSVEDTIHGMERTGNILGRLLDTVQAEQLRLSAADPAMYASRISAGPYTIKYFISEPISGGNRVSKYLLKRK